MADVCPGCGAEYPEDRASADCQSYPTSQGWVHGIVCLRRQLAQRDARIKELRAQHDTLYRAVCEVGFALGLVMPESAYLFAAQGTERVKALQSDLAAMGAKAGKLARLIVGGWPEVCDASPDPQEVAAQLGIVELRKVVPGSPDAENWGEDAELYYLADWVRELGGGA